jgi:hypothetical protein
MAMWAEVAEEQQQISFGVQGDADRCRHFADALLRNLGETGRGPWRYAVDLRPHCFGTEITVFERARACVVHTQCSEAPHVSCAAPGATSHPGQLLGLAAWLRAACN